MKVEGFERYIDFLLFYERVSQDGSGFFRILSMLVDFISIQEKRRRSFFDIEDEEKFFYGDEEEDLKVDFLLKFFGGFENEVMRQKVSFLFFLVLVVKLELIEEINSEYVKIYDLFKIIGLDIGVVEISKLVVRIQERFYGKKLLRFFVDRRFLVDRYFLVDRFFLVERRFLVDRRFLDFYRLESREVYYSNIYFLEVFYLYLVFFVDFYLFIKNSFLFLKFDYLVGYIVGLEVVGSGFQLFVVVRCMLLLVLFVLIRFLYFVFLFQFYMLRIFQFVVVRIFLNYQGFVIFFVFFDVYRYYMVYVVLRWFMYFIF